MKNRVLPEFQDFLVSRSLVPVKNTPFYANRVSKFLAFSGHSGNMPFFFFEMFFNPHPEKRGIA